MQQCRHRVAGPLALLTRDMAMRPSLADALSCNRVAAHLDMLSRSMVACAALQSDTEPTRSGGVAHLPAQMLHTPCTDAMPQPDRQAQSLRAACRWSVPCRQLRHEHASGWAHSVSGQIAAGSRAFTTEAPQTQAEKFDIIYQEAGAVRIEG